MNTISNSRRLRQQIEWVLPELGAASSRLVKHSHLREVYPEWMATVHQLMRASVPLMRTALDRCRELEQADPVAAAMAPYLEQHIKEEMHHDDWLLEDLELIGVPRANVLGRMPSSAVASLIGAHYYWIHHHHPVAKLGQIAVMEGYPSTVELIDQLVAGSGYPRAAFRTLEKHCHLDTNHRDDFDDALDDMPLGEEHHAIITTSALHTVRLSAGVYCELLERAATAGTTTPSAIIPLRQPHLMARRVGDTDTYRVEDALRGSVYHIGEHEHFLLTLCDGSATLEAVRHAYAKRFTAPLTDAELNEFLQMAKEEQLTNTNGQIWKAVEDPSRDKSPQAAIMGRGVS